MSIKGSSFNNVDNRLRNFRKLGANSSYSDALSGISTISSVVINDATIFNARLYIASGIGLYKTFNSTDNLMIESPSVIDGNFTCVENKNGILLAGTNDGKLYYSSNGDQFTEVTAGLNVSSINWGSARIWSIEYGQGLYVVAGASRLAYSSDLVNWTNARFGRSRVSSKPAVSTFDKNSSLATWQPDDNNYKIIFNQEDSKWYLPNLGNILFTDNITNAEGWQQVSDSDYYRIFGEQVDPYPSNLTGLSYSYAPVAGIALTDKVVAMKGYGGRTNYFYQPVAFSTSTSFSLDSNIGMKWTEFKEPDGKPIKIKDYFTVYSPNHISAGPGNKNIITAHYNSGTGISRVAITTDFVTYTNLGHGGVQRVSSFGYTSAMVSGSQEDNTATFQKPDMSVLYNGYLKGGNTNYYAYYSPVASSYNAGKDKWVIAYDWGGQSAYTHNSVAISTDGGTSWKAADHETENSIFNNYTSYVYSGVGSTDYYVLGKYNTTNRSYVEVSYDGEDWYSSGFGNPSSPINCSGASYMVSGISTSGKYFSGYTNGSIFATENPYVNIDRVSIPVNPNNSLEPDSLVLCLPLNTARDVNDISGIMTSYNGSSFNKTVTNNNSVGIATTVSKYYGSSASFSGVSQNLTIPASTDFTLDGEFTVEFWIYLNTIVLDSQHPSPITFSQSGGNKGQIYLNASNNYFSLWNGSSNVVNTGNNSVTTGRWYHVAVTRDSSDDCRIFLDGVLKQTASSTFTFGNASGDLRIGSFNGTGGDVNGYMNDLRIYKGYAKYTENFTPPKLADYFQYLTFSAQLNTVNPENSLTYVNTYELSAGIGTTATILTNTSVSTDRNATNSAGIATYLHDVNAGIGSTVITSTLYGNAGSATTIGISTYKFGTSSVRFTGASNSRLTGPSNAFETDDFTISFFYHAQGSGQNSYNAIYDQRPAGTNGAYPTIYSYNQGPVRYFVSSGDRITGTTNMTVASGWHHICIQRNSGVTRLFVDGTQEGSSYSDSNNYVSSTIVMGDFVFSNSYNMNANLDDLVVWKGVANYAIGAGNTIQVPTSQYDINTDPNNSYVVISSTFEDTPVGTTNIAYEANAQRGIALFNGTTSAITGTATTAFYFGKEDYTIECFYYKNTTDTSGTEYLFDGRVDNNTRIRPNIHSIAASGATLGFYLNGGYRIYGQNIGGASFGSNDSLGITTDPRYDLQGRSNLNKWNHVALCRKDGITRLYQNGKIQGVYSDSGSYDGPGMRIGNYWNGSNALNGYIQDFQVYKGYAKYYPQQNSQNDKDNWVELLNTTPPSALLVTSYVHSVRGMDVKDVNGVDTFAYACSKHVGISTRVISNPIGYGNTLNTNVFYSNRVVGIGTTSKIGSSSIKFDGNSYLSIYPQPDDLDFSTRDFSIEFWVYFNTVGTVVLWDQRPNANGFYPVIYTNSGVLTYYVNSAARITGSTLSTGQWYHIAVARTNGVTKMFLDGTQDGSSYVDDNDYFTYHPTARSSGGFGAIVGAQYNYASKLNGFMNGLRVYNGYNAGYSTNFTPPTSTLTISGDSTDEKLKILANFNVGDGYNDLLSYQHYGKRTGVNSGLTTYSSGFWNQPVSTYTAYYPQVGFGTTSKFNQSSVAFNGNNYLTFTDNRGNKISRGPEDDFSMEFWFYLETDANTKQTIWDSRPATNGFYSRIFIDTNGFLNYSVYSNSSGYDVQDGAIIVGVTTITGGTWNHVCIQRDENATALYLNGVQEGQLAADSISYWTSATPSNPAYLGCDYNKVNYLTGSIEDFKIYNGAVGYGFTVGINTGLLTNPGVSTITASPSIDKWGNGSLSVKSNTNVNFPSTSEPCSLNGKYTIEFWAYFDTVGAIITYGGRYQGNTGGFIDGIQIRNGLILFGSNYSYLNAGQTPYSTKTIPAFATGSWNHYCLQYDGNDAVWSIDGVGISTFNLGQRIIQVYPKRVYIGGGGLPIYSFSAGTQAYVSDFVSYAGTCKYPSAFEGSTFSPPSSQYDIETDSLKNFVSIAATFTGSEGSNTHNYYRTKRYTSVPTSSQVAYGDSNYKNLALLSNFNGDLTYHSYGAEDYFYPLNLSSVVTGNIVQLHKFDNKFVALGDYGFVGVSSDGNYWDVASRRGRANLSSRTPSGITSFFTPNNTQFYDIVSIGSTIVTTAPGSVTLFSEDSGADEFRKSWAGNSLIRPNSGNVYTSPLNGGYTIAYNPNTQEWLRNDRYGYTYAGWSNLYSTYYAKGMPNVGLGTTTPYNWTSIGQRFFGLLGETGKTINKIKYEDNKWILIGSVATGSSYYRIGITTDLLNIDDNMKLTSFSSKKFKDIQYDPDKDAFIITSQQPQNRNSLGKDILIQDIGFNTVYNDTQTQRQFMDDRYRSVPGFGVTDRAFSGKSYVHSLQFPISTSPYLLYDQISQQQTGRGPWIKSARIEGYFKPAVVGIHTFKLVGNNLWTNSMEFSFDDMAATLAGVEDTYTTESLDTSTYYRFSIDSRYLWSTGGLQYASPNTDFTYDVTGLVFAQAGVGTTGALLNEVPYYEYGDSITNQYSSTDVIYTHKPLNGTLKGPDGYVLYGDRGFVGFGTNLENIRNFKRESYKSVNNLTSSGIGTVIYNIFGTNNITSGIYTGGKYVLFDSTGTSGISTNGVDWESSSLSEVTAGNITSVGISSSGKIILTGSDSLVGITTDFSTYTVGYASTSLTDVDFDVVSGGIAVSAASSAYGGSSVFFNNAGTLKITNNPLANIGSGDFTIEGWFNSSDSASGRYVVTVGSYYNGYSDQLFYWSSGTWYYYSTTASGSWNVSNGNSWGAVSTNTWVHLAVEKIGSTFRLYKDGVGVTTFTSSPTYSGDRPLLISSYQETANVYYGYIQDFRIYSKAKYNSSGSGVGNTFTPPTSFVDVLSDPDSSNVAVAASFSGTAGSTPVYDKFGRVSNLTSIPSSSTVTAVGGIGTVNMIGLSNGIIHTTDDTLGISSALFPYTDSYTENTPYLSSYGNAPTLSSTQTKFQPTSLDLTGSVNMKVTLDGFKYANGSGDFCFEFWGYYTGGSTFFEYNVYNNGFMLRSDNFYGGCGGAPFTANQWVHYAIIRSGATTYYYRDGVLDCSFTASGPSDASLHIGSSAHTSGQYASGYISDLVVTSGHSRYNVTGGAAFTPPSSAYDPTTDPYVEYVVHYSTFTGVDGTTGYPTYGAGLTRVYSPDPFAGNQINKIVGIGSYVVGIASNGYYAYARQDNINKWYSGKMGDSDLVGVTGIGISTIGISTNASVAAISTTGNIYISGLD